MKKSHLAGAASAICLIAAMHVPAFSQASFPSRRAFPQARSLPSRFASRVVDFIQGSGTGVFQPENALDGPLGGGAGAGSTTSACGGSATVGRSAASWNAISAAQAKMKPPIDPPLSVGTPLRPGQIITYDL